MNGLERWLALALVWGCGGHVDLFEGLDAAAVEDAAVDAEVPGLALGSARCSHDRFGSLVEGQDVDCTVFVTGPEGRSATLTCEDDSGAPLDCCGSTLDRCEGTLDFPTGFEAPSVGLAGSSYSLTLVATDGVDTVRRRYEIPVIADDGVNVAPELVAIRCGSEPDIVVPTGVTRGCAFEIVDPDPPCVRSLADRQHVRLGRIDYSNRGNGGSTRRADHVLVHARRKSRFPCFGRSRSTMAWRHRSSPRFAHNSSEGETISRERYTTHRRRPCFESR